MRFIEQLELDREGRELLRKRVDEELDKITDFNEIEDKRIVLDDADYEDLLFEECTDKNDYTFKRFAFFSHNLHKLDLSNVSFDDVSWNGYDKDYHFPVWYDMESPEEAMIDLSNTNAIIDLSESYEFKRKGQVILAFVNFSNTNLSNNDWNKLTEVNPAIIKYCNLSNTKLLGNNYDPETIKLDISHSDISHNDLSKLQIVIDIKNPNRNNVYLGSTDVVNTGIHFIYDPIEDKSIVEGITTKPIFAGCYLNGTFIDTPAPERKTPITSNLHINNERRRINKTLTLINKQIDKIKNDRSAY